MSSKNKNLASKLIGWSYIKGSLVETKNLLKSERKENYLVETFDEALERLDITSDDEIHLAMSRNYKGRMISSYIMITASILVLAQLIYNITVHTSNISYISILIQFLAFTALFLMGSYDSFRCYQIRVRKLGGLNEYVKSIKNLYPTRFSKIQWINDLAVKEDDIVKEGDSDAG